MAFQHQAGTAMECLSVSKKNYSFNIQPFIKKKMICIDMISGCKI